MQNAFKLRKDSLEASYTQYELGKIVSELRSKGLIITSKAQLKKNETGAINCVGLDNRSILVKALKSSNEEILKEIENHDYEKGYKYSMIFENAKIKQVAKPLDYIKYNEKSIDYIGKNFEKPTINVVGDETFVKFTREIKNKNTLTETRLYTVLCIINNITGIIEVRFDQASDRFKASDQFYIESAKKVKSWIQRHFGISLKTINFTYIIDKIVNSGDDNIRVCYEDMILENKCRASFQATENTLELPVIGDLQKIIQDNPQVFTENSDARKIIESYIKKVYATSEFPKRGIRWLEENKQVMFIHNYKSESDTLIHHYAENNNKEMMDHVREYVIKHRKRVKKKKSNR